MSRVMSDKLTCFVYIKMRLIQLLILFVKCREKLLKEKRIE
jgi:hypothetical protein